MGRRDRERVNRIRKGEEQSIASRVLSNPISRKAVAVTSRRGVIEELSKGNVTERTNKLDELTGTGVLGAGRLKSAIMSKAPREMDKGIRKLQKQGKKVTVDALCSEVRSEPGFIKLCANVGLTVNWFEELARRRMKKRGIEES